MKSIKTSNTKKIYDNVFGNNSNFYKLIPHEDINRLVKRIKLNDSKFKLTQKKILVAGGSGRAVLAFLKKKPKELVYVDLVPENINRIKKITKNNDTIKCINLDMNKINTIFSKNYFDVIYLEGIFQHLNEPNKTFLELLNVLQTNGYFYLDFYRSGIVYSLITELARKKIHFKDFVKFKSFLEKKKLHKKKLSYSISNLSERIYDDLFVPNIRFYDPKITKKILEKNGLTTVYFDKFKSISEVFNSYTVFHAIIKKSKSIKKINIFDVNNEKIFNKIPKYKSFIKNFNDIKFKEKHLLFNFISKLFLDYSIWNSSKNSKNTIKIMNNFTKDYLN